jgi:hypothetical protein
MSVFAFETHQTRQFQEEAMRLTHCVLIQALILAALLSTAADAQRVGGGDRRGDRLPAGRTTLPAVENYSPMAAGVFEVVTVQTSDRVVRLRASDGKTADVGVAEHVFDLSKLKAGDKVKVDFFQPDEANPKLNAAGIWPVQPAQ